MPSNEAPMRAMMEPAIDPFKDLTLQEFAAASGLTCGQIVHAKENAELFSCRVNGESFGRFPAYQLRDEIRGQPLRALIAALGADGGPTLYMFMRGAGDLLGNLSPVEVLCGQIMGEDPVTQGARDFLALDHFARFQGVLTAAECWNVDDGPESEADAQDRLHRRSAVWTLGSVPWIYRAEVERRVKSQEVEGVLRDHKIFMIPSVIGLDLFAPYVFSSEGELSPVIPDVLRWLEYPWGMSIATWFESASSFLNGARPRDEIFRAPHLVLAAARNTYELTHYP